MRCGTTYGTDGPSLTSCRACGRQGHPGTRRHGRIKNFRRAGQIAGGVQRRAGAQPGLGIASDHDWLEPSRSVGSWPFLTQEKQGPGFCSASVPCRSAARASQVSRVASGYVSFSISASLNFFGTMLRRHIARFVRSLHVLDRRTWAWMRFPLLSGNLGGNSSRPYETTARQRSFVGRMQDTCKHRVKARVKVSGWA